MTKLPFGLQLILLPLLAVALCVGVLFYLYTEVGEVYEENTRMREQAVLVSETRGLLRGVNELRLLAEKIATAPSDQLEDLRFSYLDEYRLYRDVLVQPLFQSALSDDQRAELNQLSQDLTYSESLDPAQIVVVADRLQDWLVEAHDGFFSSKRASYLQYYQNVNGITENLKGLILGVLGVGVVTILFLGFWAVWGFRQRLNSLVDDAGALCDLPAGRLRSYDDLARLQLCLRNAKDKMPEAGAELKLLQGVESERRRLAMDVHDVVLADITAILRRTRELKLEAHDDISSQLDALETEAQSVLEDLRGVVEDLYPRVLDMLGLEEAIRSYLKKRQKLEPGMKFQARFEGKFDNGLDQFGQLNVYRIIQEAVNNVIHHSKATRVEVVCRRRDNVWQFSVEDNGIATEAPRVESASSFGLNNIRQRARAIGAQVHWGRSRFSSGLRLDVEMAGSAHA